MNNQLEQERTRINAYNHVMNNMYGGLLEMFDGGEEFDAYQYMIDTVERLDIATQNVNSIDRDGRIEAFRRIIQLLTPVIASDGMMGVERTQNLKGLYEQLGYITQRGYIQYDIVCAAIKEDNNATLSPWGPFHE